MKKINLCELQPNYDLTKNPIILRFAGLQKAKEAIMNIGYNATVIWEDGIGVPSSISPVFGSDGIKSISDGFKKVISKFRGGGGELEQKTAANQ